MIDVKKFITGFLILAAVVSSSALVLSNFGSTSITPAPQTAVAYQTVTSYGGNAFGPAGSASTDNQALTDSVIGTSSDPNNVTDNLTTALLNGIVAANPDGPQDDASGTASFVSPDQNAIAASLATNPNLQNFQAPNWDLEVADQKLNIAATSSPQQIEQYASNLSQVLNSYFVSTGLQGMVDPSNSDTSNLPYIESQINQTLENVTGLTAPSQLANFQKSLVAMLVYEKNAVALTGSIGDDPVKTSLIFQAEQAKYQAAINTFNGQLQKIQSAGTFSFNDKASSEKTNGLIASLQSLVGIKTANAQFGGLVTDPVTEAETTLTVGQLIWQWAQEIILQVLKNTLINQVQKNILSWVQGKGVPRFVQQWGATFANAFNSAALSTVMQITPQLSPSFSGVVAGALQPNQSLTSGIKSTLDQTLATQGTTPQAFSTNFSAGGFSGYMALFAPDNNVFSAMMATNDAAMNAAGDASRASQAKTAAGQGFTGDEVCADGSDPTSGTHTVCLDGDDVPYSPNSDGTCDPGFFASQEPNGGLCSDGSDPQVTTPGQTTNQAVGSATGSDVHLIVNADNVVDLALSVATTLLSNLTHGFNLLGSSPTPPPNTTPPTPLTCSTTISPVTINGTQATGYFTANGGTATNGVPSTYTWTTTGGTLSASTGNFVTVNYTTPGTYTATVTASSGGSATCNITVN